ncbi:MAG: hypothetical protein AAF828_08485, partial [Bacteroidota bacterium]
MLILALSLSQCDRSTAVKTAARPSIQDSVKFGNIIVYNGFKQQLAAFESTTIDTGKIVEDLYARHQIMWDSCYGMIFGPDNATKFQTAEGMVQWNQALFTKDRDQIDSLRRIITAYDLDSLFNFHTNRFMELGYSTPSARITIADSWKRCKGNR